MEMVREPTRISRLCRFTLCMALVEPYLLTDAETADQFRVPFRVFALEIVQQPPALADELEEPAAGVVVLRVRLEVFGEVIDPLAEKSDLNFRRSGIAVVCLVRSDKVGLAVLAQRHWCSSTCGPGSPHLRKDHQTRRMCYRRA